MEEGNYENAISTFESIRNYKDSETKLKECTALFQETQYYKALSLMEATNYAQAYKILATLGDYQDADSLCENARQEKNREALRRFSTSIKIGSIITFGTYEQDNDKDNGKEEIEWICVGANKEQTQILVVSKYALDCKQYNIGSYDVTWETSSLRRWLNSDFINSAFSKEEQTIIPTSRVWNFENRKYKTDAGKVTYDKVFVLSLDEISSYYYFLNEDATRCKVTEYAIANGGTAYSEYCRWWLRSPGYDQSYAVEVWSNGEVYEMGSHVNDDGIAVRPAMWIDLSAIQ